MTPFLFQWGGFFVVGVLGVASSVVGLVVLFLGWWWVVGYRPTGSSKKPKPPLGGTNPSTRKS